MTQETEIQRRAVSGHRASILAALRDHGVDRRIIAHLEIWDDGFARNVAVILHYKRLRDIGVPSEQAIDETASWLGCARDMVEILAKGKGYGKAHTEAKRQRRLQAEEQSHNAVGIPTTP
ncbi:hypothetical protein KMZ68_02085 [Bradyrhizobium sediminis]|uniref:Uncharacterized protein n=1 Tax=Bradyrhizobium sediminis TaxID=2840469 RepID=A0A975NPM8_9BRAD|nr:hypothetical protein [Bradyrhizobium sediminis]QWG18710.1 hypothetical protein KMZ68_02085 [Bradyrhizobium sediminis]